MEKAQNWSETPQEVIGLIAERITSIEDYVRFGGVCQTWRSVIIDQRQSKFSSRTLPWLMFPKYVPPIDEYEYENENENENVDDNYIETQVFFSLSANKIHKLNWPVVANCCCWGSPHGWLVVIHGLRLQILNPLSHDRLPLPSLLTFEDIPIHHYFIQRSFLSIRPPSSSTTHVKERFEVLVSFCGDGKLAFARPGDEAWTVIGIPNAVIDDILYFNNQYYIIDTSGIVRCFDITHPSPIEFRFIRPLGDLGVGGDYERSFSLVELLGELHMVVRFRYIDVTLQERRLYMPRRRYDMSYFRVFKLILSAREEWEEVFTLGRYAIFIGQNSSFSLLLSDYPECASSSIYFIDYWLVSDLYTGGMGIFNLETGTLEPFYKGEGVGPLYDSPLWFIPSLC